MPEDNPKMSLGPTPARRVLKRYKLLKAYLRRRDFCGVWLSHKEVEEIVELLRPHMEGK